MPLYEYECDACGKRFEVIQKLSDAPIDTCRSCGASGVRKLQSAPAIQFKGTGWYITDYARKDQAGSKKEDGTKDSSKASSEKKDSAAETTKSTTTTEAASPSSSSGSSGPSTPTKSS